MAERKLDYVTLRAKVHQYLRSKLAAGKQKINADGPWTAERKEQAREALSSLEAGNSTFWKSYG